MSPERKLRQDVFIRVCRDSGFTMDTIRAAQLAARVAKCDPLEIWIAVGDLLSMERIASGSHPCCALPHPKNETER
jgi:hypothetical protein